MMAITAETSARLFDWTDRLFRGVGYVLTRGAVLGLGAGALFLGYAWGWGDGNDAGFMSGCRATTTDPACLYAQDIGKQIRETKVSDFRGRVHPATAAEKADKLAVLCDDLRDRLSRRAATYYGCDEL